MEVSDLSGKIYHANIRDIKFMYAVTDIMCKIHESTSFGWAVDYFVTSADVHDF